MRARIWVTVVVMALCAPAYANGQGKAKGQAQEPPSRAGKMVGEAMDVVADELLDEKGRVRPSGKPPGLAKKDAMPPGLAKQGKTPPGWEKGQKEGWDNGKKESPFRRLIRGIFRKSTQPAPKSQQ